MEADADRLEVTAHFIDERRLAGTGRAGDDEERPV
jgi:hypothetical protein